MPGFRRSSTEGSSEAAACGLQPPLRRHAYADQHVYVFSRQSLPAMQHARTHIHARAPGSIDTLQSGQLMHMLCFALHCVMLLRHIGICDIYHKHAYGMHQRINVRTLTWALSVLCLALSQACQQIFLIAAPGQ